MEGIELGMGGINLGRGARNICMIDIKEDSDVSPSKQQYSNRAVSPDLESDSEETQSVPVLNLAVTDNTNSQNEALINEDLGTIEEKSFALHYKGIQETPNNFPGKGELTPQEFAELTSSLAANVFNNKSNNSRFRHARKNPIKVTIGQDFLEGVDLQTAEQPMNLQMADILSFKAAPTNGKSKSSRTEALLMARGAANGEPNKIVCHRLQFKSQTDIREFFMTMRASFEREYKKTHMNSREAPQTQPDSLNFSSDC